MQAKQYYLPNSIEAFRYNIENFAHNPSMVQRTVLEYLQALNNGSIQIVDATNPVAFTVEAASVLMSHFISTDELLTRKQYPVSALTESDLYLHMSDVDYIDRFAIPSRAKFHLVFDMAELIDKMVFDEELGVKRLIIPRNSRIEAGEIPFTLEYPIELRQMPHGGIHVVYNTEHLSPIHKLTTNTVDYVIRKTRDIDWFLITISAMQLDAKSHIVKVTPSSESRFSFNFTNDYFYCRIWHKTYTDEWVEILTTHTPELYDPVNVTASLRVVDNELQIYIPQLYTNTGMIDGEVRVDIYTTMGDLQMDLGGLTPNDYELTFKPFDVMRDTNEFTVPVNSISSFSIFSSDRTTGGRDKLSFEKLRERVIQNSIGPKNTPISNVDIQTVLIDEGFENVQHIDNVTNRVYLASKRLPLPSNDKLITSASTSIETLITTLDDMSNHEHIIFNDESVTITPDVIFESRDGSLRIVDDALIREIQNLPIEQRTKEVNKRHLYYTPFHYVMDMENHLFDFRAYYLDEPAIITKEFGHVNPTTLIDVNIDEYEIVKTRHGYELTILTKSGDDFKTLQHEDVLVQMSFRPSVEKDLAYVMGEFIGVNNERERMYRFKFDTNWNLNKLNELVLTNFKMYTDEDTEVPTPLHQKFDIIFLTTKAMGSQFKPSQIDRNLATFLLNKPVVAIIKESITIEFGQTLTSLWKQSRTIASTEQYERYENDVPLLHAEDVYDIVEENGTTTYELKYEKGTPVLDSKGQPVMRFKAGDIKLDEKGNKVISNGRQLARQMDIMLVEGAYYFATDTIAKDYRKEIIQIFLDWLIDGLDELNKTTLEQTRIYFYPRATLGNVPILYNNGIRATIKAQQSMVINLVVSRNVYANMELRDAISKTTVEVISELLQETTISNSMIYAKLVEFYGHDVIGVKLSGLGGETDITALTILDDTKRIVLNKRLATQPDNTLIVEEDVTINFQLLDNQQKVW